MQAAEQLFAEGMDRTECYSLLKYAADATGCATHQLQQHDFSHFMSTLYA